MLLQPLFVFSIQSTGSIFDCLSLLRFKLPVHRCGLLALTAARAGHLRPRRPHRCDLIDGARHRREFRGVPDPRSCSTVIGFATATPPQPTSHTGLLSGAGGGASSARSLQLTPPSSRAPAGRVRRTRPSSPQRPGRVQKNLHLLLAIESHDGPRTAAQTVRGSRVLHCRECSRARRLTGSLGRSGAAKASIGRAAAWETHPCLAFSITP